MTLIKAPNGTILEITSNTCSFSNKATSELLHRQTLKTDPVALSASAQMFV